MAFGLEDDNPLALPGQNRGQGGAGETGADDGDVVGGGFIYQWGLLLSWRMGVGRFSSVSRRKHRRDRVFPFCLIRHR